MYDRSEILCLLKMYQNQVKQWSHCIWTSVYWSHFVNFLASEVVVVMVATEAQAERVLFGEEGAVAGQCTYSLFQNFSKELFILDQAMLENLWRKKLQYICLENLTCTADKIL